MQTLRIYAALETTDAGQEWAIYAQYGETQMALARYDITRTRLYEELERLESTLCFRGNMIDVFVDHDSLKALPS